LLVADTRCAYAPHWYDLKCLFEKRWSATLSFDVQALSQGSRNIFKHMYFGISGMKRNYTQQMRRLFEICQSDVPRLIGETGVPMDMNQYFHTTRSKRTENTAFQVQTQALDCVITACERNLLPYCLWNYTPENIEGKGDFWNREDLSIFSLQHFDNTAYGGARALRAFIRPGAIKVAGIPTKSEFDLASGLYTLVFIPNAPNIQEADSGPSLSKQSEIFVPNLLTAGKSSPFTLSIKCGSVKWRSVVRISNLLYFISHACSFDDKTQTVLLWHSASCSKVHLELQFEPCNFDGRVSWRLVAGISLCIACAGMALNNLLPKFFEGKK
jgi:hypothetical protein